MKALPEPLPRPRTARRRRPAVRLLLPAIAAIVVFAVGVALGEALHDNPKPGGNRTVVKPLTLTVEPETVTVTVTGR